MFGSELIEDRVRNPQQKGPAIVPFITAGYPHKDGFLSLVQALADCADVIEIGVPFSDPMADGVTIQRSSHLAIESGVRLRWILNQLKTISINTPIILMSYLNPLYVYGYTQLAQASKDAGVDGFIVPDLPIEEGEELREILKLAGLGMIQLVTPTTPKDRIKKIAAKSSGFLYAVTVKGVTGGNDGLPQEVTGYLETVKALTTIPVCAGFGVRSRSDVALLEPLVDGVIVGSALVEAIEDQVSPVDFLTSLRA
ncbi:MAG TPA: tryptophan synthase subunit alpha [Candidatus Thioglobus sp.]|jgi:tryptophan synthase alpha chain|nr:tryptophan synthase subunit alpha [Candidatus Thioglobus sp.]HIK77455.1 tryptophan synthase subunit alpha [Gammaproteobacteria bacterium]